MKLCNAKQIQIEAHRLVASIEREDPPLLVAANLGAIIALCSAGLVANSVPAFFRPPSDEAREPKQKGNHK